MDSDSETFCCEAMRKRNIPSSVFKSNGNPKNVKEEEKKSGTKPVKPTGIEKKKTPQETEKQKVERINQTKVSFMEFYNECLDWDMLRIFFTMLFLFFCAVGVASIIYLCFIYMCNQKLWNIYFPSTKRDEL